MDGPRERFVSGFELRRVEAENPVELVRPEDLVALDLPFPASDAGNPLRLSELKLSLAKSVFGLLAPNQ